MRPNAGVRALTEKYKIRNLGAAWQLLGIEIHHDKNTMRISLDQEALISMILRRLHMQDARALATPMDNNVRLDLTEDWGGMEFDSESVKHYQAMVGSMIYAPLAMPTDRLHSGATLCPFNSDPFTTHMTAAMRVLQDLKATADFRLYIYGNGNG